MLQVAIGGYRTAPASFNDSHFETNPAYKEPSFLALSEPLVFSSTPECDQLFVLVRKRADLTSSTFTSINPSDLSIVVTDATNGQIVPASLVANTSGSSYYHSGWNNTGSRTFTPVIGVITNSLNYSNPVTRVRALDVMIKEVGDTAFIRFRILILDSDKLFHFINIDVDNIAGRSTFSAASRQAVIRIGGASDTYMIFSPYAYLRETTKDNSDFSYPIDSIYYQRQKTFNDEGFIFSIEYKNHSWLLDNISLINVPHYDKAAILLVDKHIYSDFAQSVTSAFITIKVYGKISEQIDYFKVYLAR